MLVSSGLALAMSIIARVIASASFAFCSALRPLSISIRTIGIVSLLP